MKKLIRLSTVFCLVVFALNSATAAELSIIFLTRHGEKVADGSKDPDLTPQGQARARNIAALLAKSGITRIYSTETRRTQQTAAPLAAALALPVQPYDAAQQAAFARQVRTLTGATFIVGHSNTLSELVRELGGKPGPEIGDDEYDRLYQLIVDADGRVRTVMLSSSAKQ